jgi:hypothetical protein
MHNDFCSSKRLAIARPNILPIMTVQERYTPRYESPELAALRLSWLPAPERLRASGLELYHH